MEPLSKLVFNKHVKKKKLNPYTNLPLPSVVDIFVSNHVSRINLVEKSPSSLRGLTRESQHPRGPTSLLLSGSGHGPRNVT